MSERTDADRYRLEHLLIFGHEPIADLSTGKRCGHPIHDDLQRLIDGPGNHVEIPFSWRVMISDDDDVVLDAHADYDERVDQFRDKITDVEDQIAFERRRSTRHLF